MNSPTLHLIQNNLAAVAGGLFIALTLVALALFTRKWARSRVARRRAARALRGERRAAGLLSRHGYRLRDAQLAITYSPALGGRGFPVALRADYLVSRGGRRYVAEVKTGERAPSLSHAPTRRQLLEYSVAFDVDGVLLVDVEAGSVEEVVFPRGPAARRASWKRGAALWLLGVVLLLAAAASVASRFRLEWPTRHPPARCAMVGR